MKRKAGEAERLRRGRNMNDRLCEENSKLERTVARQRASIRDLRARLHTDPPQRTEGRHPLPETLPFNGLSPAEAEFTQRAVAKGWMLYRAGWPDFLCFDPSTKKFLFVEVKAQKDRLQVSQRAMFAVMEELGIQVRIFRPGLGALIPWRKLDQYESEKLETAQQRGALDVELAPTSQKDAGPEGASWSARGPNPGEGTTVH